ncbi:MAG: hypothetical protein BWY83_01429 [bacterium ADurb.Bin478]|nr:MAG: hypothetical protein BWY83_01429 [bacterium ADurb.Bin478]
MMSATGRVAADSLVVTFWLEVTSFSTNGRWAVMTTSWP